MCLRIHAVLGFDTRVCIGPCSRALYSPGNLLGSYEP